MYAWMYVYIENQYTKIAGIKLSFTKITSY